MDDAAEGRDAGPDGGPVALDAGRRDSGPIGPVDAGHVDGGPPDAGIPSYQLSGSVMLGATRGGTGANAYEAACGPTEVVVGHDGYAGTNGEPNYVAIHCAELQSDGRLGATRTLTAIAADRATCGPPIGSSWVQACPSGMVAVGLHGAIVRWSGYQVVGQMGLTCAPLAQWVRDGTGADALPVTTTSSDTVLTTFDDRCPAGYVLTEVKGTSGCFIDAVSIGCRRVTS